MEPFILLAIFSSFFLAGGVKGVSGLGLPTVSLALLGLVMPPAVAAALLVVPSLATNVAQSLGKHWAVISRKLWPMWCGILLGALMTPLPTLSSNTPHVRIGLGVVLVVYGFHGLLKPKASLRATGWRLLTVSAATGYVTGVLTAATGVFIVPMVMFLQSLSLDKDEMIQALGVSFLVCTLALAGSLGWARSTEVIFTIQGIIACVAAFAGLFVGTRVRNRINLETFRKVLFATFPVLGLAMLLKDVL